MNKEIKEILEYLKDKNDYIEDFGISYKRIHIDNGDLKLLLDYITNLQQQLHQASLDIQELTERDIECPSWCDKLTNLQQENKEANDSITWWTNRFKAVERDNRELKQENERLKEELFKSVNNTNNSMELTENYKSRCEKAIEELKQAYTDIQNNDNANYIHIAFRNDLLNILQNGSDTSE